MKSLRIIGPVVVTVLVTAVAILSALWLTGLVPPGAWAGLIKAAIIIFVIGSALILVAWSAYFAYIIRDTVENLMVIGKH